MFSLPCKGSIFKPCNVSHIILCNSNRFTCIKVALNYWEDLKNSTLNPVYFSHLWQTLDDWFPCLCLLFVLTVCIYVYSVHNVVHLIFFYLFNFFNHPWLKYCRYSVKLHSINPVTPFPGKKDNSCWENLFFILMQHVANKVLNRNK